MQKDYNKIQQACDRIFDASPLAVKFVQKVSTHAWAGTIPQGSRDQQWLPKQASTGLFKVGTSCRPPPLKASTRPAVSYMDMFGKRANTSTDRSMFEKRANTSADKSLGLVPKSGQNLSSKKQVKVSPQTRNGLNLSAPCIANKTLVPELGRLPGRYGLRTRERGEVGRRSVNKATAKPEKNEQPRPVTKRAAVAPSLNKRTEQWEASQYDDILSNHSGVESSQSSDEEQVIRSIPTATVGPLEVTGQNFVSQGDVDIDSHSSDGEHQSEGSSEEEEDVQSSQIAETDNKLAEKTRPSQVNSASSQSEREDETSSDEEGVPDELRTGNLQLDTKEVDSDVNTKLNLVNKEPGQRQGSLKILRLTTPEDTPKSVRGRKSQTHRQRGSNSGLDRSALIKSTKGSTSLKSINDSLNRRVRRKEKILDTSKHKQTLDSIAHKGSEKDPLAVNDLPKTRSGRRVKPPLVWWAGQRVFVHPNVDIVEIKPPTPSNDRDALPANMKHFKEDDAMERSMRLASRKRLVGKYKTKTSLNKSESLQMRSVMEGSCHQTCRRVKAGAYHNNDQGNGNERQSTQHSVSTPLSRSMPLYQSDSVHSEDDVLEKFDTPGLPKHLRNPPAVTRIRLSQFPARTLEVEDVEADDLCRSFGSTPVNQLVKQRAAENRRKRNKLTELEQETLTRKSQSKISKPQENKTEVKRGPGRPRKTVTSETLYKKSRKVPKENQAVQEPQTSKRRTRRQYASSIESDSESMQNGYGKHVYKKEKQTRVAGYQMSCSDYSDEEVIEELPSRPLTKPQRSNRRPKLTAREENVNKRFNSKPHKKLGLSVSEDASDSDEEREPAPRQRGTGTSSNERKVARAQCATGKKSLKKDGKSGPVQGKKKVFPANISENEVQASKSKTKAFTDKENINVPSTSDSVEDIWNNDEITLYKQALRQLNPSMDNFWYHVALLVETKTAQQCQGYHQRSAPSIVQKKKAVPPPKTNKGQKPGLTGRAGTLKRKRELKTMIEELNHNHEDDFFDATPVRQAKRLKVPTQDDEDDDDFYQNRPNTETPLSTRFTTPNPRLAWMPTLKTPVTSILSPSLTNTVDRKNTEAYVHRLLSKQHRRGTAIGKVVEQQEPLHPDTHKMQESVVSQTLFKKDTPQEEDSEVEEDYYFSDCNE